MDLLKRYRAMAGVKKGGGGLPAGYIQTEWIQSTGTQWIDTGIEGASNLTVECTYKMISGTLWQAVFGCRSSSKNFYFIKDEVGYGSTKYTNSLGVNTYQIKTDINWVDNEITLSNTDGIHTTQLSASQTFTTGNNIYLFAFNNYGTAGNIGYTAICSFKISSNTGVLIDLIPCYDEINDENGMFDLVSNTFFRNSGTGKFISPYDYNFIKGDNVNINNLPSEYQEVNWLQSNGTQYIDTGVSGTSAYGLYMELLPSSIIDNYQSYMGGQQDNFGIGAQGALNQCYIFFRAVRTLVGADATNFNTLEFSNGKMTWNGTDYNTTANVSLSTNSANITLFAAANNTRPSGCKIKSCQIKDNNYTTIRNMIPCYKKLTNITGMYDKINDIFYPNNNLPIL